VQIYIGSDHNGIELKNHLLDFLVKSHYQVRDEGDLRLDPEDDFPIFASRVVNAMKASSDPQPLGILICGSGQGMCMAANRYKGMRASLCWNISEAHAARNDDNSNILCLSAKSTNKKEAEVITNTWLTTSFAGASRFTRRLKELDNLT